MFSPNLAILTDSYKVTHWMAYPPDTSRVYSYFESRGGAFKDQVMFGLQSILMEYFTLRVTPEQVEDAKVFWGKHFGNDTFFNYDGWMRIATEFEGKLPLRVRAVPEGTVVPWHNVLMTMENTHPDFFWLTNWMETIGVHLWYPMTVATNSRELKKLWLKYLEMTGDPSTVDFKHHDFGFRGSTSFQSAAIGGMAHLVNFLGTDTSAGIQAAQHYYGADMAGFSVIATEHSTMTSWTEEREFDAVVNLLNKAPKDAIVSCVGDSWDIFRFAQVISTDETIKRKIMERTGKFVVRPDSGSPATTSQRLLEILGANFGFTVNSKGYKELPPYIGLIWGDGIDYMMAREILETIRGAGWSANNIVMGSGGGLLQKFDRDTLRFAFKCSAATIDGKEVEVFKRPITDHGKASKKGELALTKHPEYGTFETVHPSKLDGRENYLVPVFENGEMIKTYSWDEVRAAAAV